MASAKIKSAQTHPARNTLKQGESAKLLGKNEDLRLGMERRKFSYTIHIPERRSGQKGSHNLACHKDLLRGRAKRR